MTYNKYFRNICLFAGLALAMASCTKNFEEINTPRQESTDATTPELFNGIVSSLPVMPGEYATLNAWIYPITQQAIVTSGSYPYDNAINDLWKNYYSTMSSYRLIEDRINQSADKASMNNMYAMLKTIMAYKTFKMTNYFGNMPYSKAGYVAIKGAEGYKPAYDKQEDIYAALLTDLKWAVDNFSTAAGQYSVGSYETFLKNDIAMWSKFANSLRLLVAVTMYGKNTAAAGPAIAEALGKPLLEAGEDIGIWPTKIPGLKLEWRQWALVTNNYLRFGSTMWNLMANNANTDGSGIFDIRARIFYEPNNAGGWAAYPQNPTSATPTEGGAPYDLPKRTINWNDKGAANIYSSVNFNFAWDMTIHPEPMLTAAQVYFLKAEAYNRGAGIAANPVTAKAEYDKGIAASLNMWKGVAFSAWTVGKPAAAAATTAEIAAVTTNPKTAYDLTNPARALEQIYAQYWIDAFRQPWDAWTLKRRTGNKTPMSADNVTYYNNNFASYARFVYPQEEFSFNFENWRAETNSNDRNTTKIWIMP